MKKAVSSLGLILALSPIASAMADSHFYVGGRVGASTMQGGCNGRVACDNEDVAGGLVLGYNFGQVSIFKGLSLEATYDYLGEYDFSRTAQTGVHNADVSAFTLAPKFDFGITDSTNLYTKFGAAWVNNEVKTDSNRSADSTSMLAGIGIDHRATDMVNLRLEYQYIKDINTGMGDDTYTSYANDHGIYAGVTFHFNRAPLFAAVEPAPVIDEPVQEPVIAEPVVEIQTVPAEQSVAQFEFSSSTLSEEEKAQLMPMVERLQNYDAATASIIGFTDSTGPDSINIEISQDRARNVAEFFIENGISVERLDVQAQGDNAPIATNATLEGRKQNRRVEITSPEFEIQVQG